MLDTKAHLGPNKKGFMLGIICCYTNDVLKMQWLKTAIYYDQKTMGPLAGSAGFSLAVHLVLSRLTLVDWLVLASQE